MMNPAGRGIILTLAINSPTMPLVKVEDLADTTAGRRNFGVPASVW